MFIRVWARAPGSPDGNHLSAEIAVAVETSQTINDTASEATGTA
jgi:hypothetical protein